MQAYTALRKIFFAEYTALRKIFFAEYAALRKMFGYYLTDKTTSLHKKTMQKQSLFLHRFVCRFAIQRRQYVSYNLALMAFDSAS